MNPCNYFPWGYLKDSITPTHTEEITVDTLSDTFNNFVIHLQQVHKVELSLCFN